MYNRNNFYKHTFCLFIQVSETELPFSVPSYKSNSGSIYYFTEIGVYRKSNHWGRAANCRWRLLTKEKYKNQQILIGFANWTDFYKNNEIDNLFFIVLENNEVTFNHKNHNSFSSQMLRNASDTAKRIKEIKKVLQDNNWAKHLNIDDLKVAKYNLIQELINTNESFVNLKMKLINTKK